MCGIAGILDLNVRPVGEETLARMIRILRHRGPDGEGFYIGPGIGLGHRRLAVIDLSEAARQPMCNEDGTLWIVLNGEIYNYRDLRTELNAKGHAFKSGSDTEVILHLYEEEGTACVGRLRGMFAFALWDEPHRRLVLARDRVGQKPLVYGVSEGKLFFASEVKALLQAPEVRGTVSPATVDLFFTFGFAPWPHTMFEGIRKLPPASLLIAEGGRLRVEQYWRVDLDARSPSPVRKSSRELLGLLRETIRVQMVSDVPLGVLLSGGLDSSTTAALMAEMSAEPLRTFSVGFRGRGEDPDLAFARGLADRLGAEHREVLVDASIIDHLPRVLWHYDEPYANPSALAHYELCAAMKPVVTVVHSGDGGDELFGGYEGYRNWKLVDRIGCLLAPAPGLGSLLSSLAAGAGRGNGRLGRVGAFVRLATLPPEIRRGVKKAMDAAPVRAVYSEDLKAAVAEDRAEDLLNGFYRDLGPGAFLDKLLLVDLLLHNSHSATMFSDVTGMAHAVEVRSIFLDHKVVEFAAALPASQKVRGFDQRKYVLRQAVRDLLPVEILSRPKVGYAETIPYRRLLRDEWRERAAEVLLGGTLTRTGFFDGDAIHGLWRAYLQGEEEHFDLLWALTCFGVWHEALPRLAIAQGWN